MLRRVLLAMFVAVLVVGLIGCAEEKKPATGTKPKTPTTATKQATKAPTKEAKKAAGATKKQGQQQLKKATEDAKKAVKGLLK